jgi:hypothetical protein
MEKTVAIHQQYIRTDQQPMERFRQDFKPTFWLITASRRAPKLQQKSEFSH